MLDGGKAKLPRLDRRRSPPAPPPSVAAAVPPPPLLRRWWRRFWLRLGDQRKLINELPTGAPPVQLAAQLRPRVRLRRRRGFGLRRFFGAAGFGRPRCAPPRIGLALAPASPSVVLIALVALNRRVAFVFLRNFAARSRATILGDAPRVPAAPPRQRLSPCPHGASALTLAPARVAEAPARAARVAGGACPSVVGVGSRLRPLFRNLGGTAAEQTLERARQPVERLRRDLGGSARDAADRSRRALRGAGRLLAGERLPRRPVSQGRRSALARFYSRNVGAAVRPDARIYAPFFPAQAAGRRRASAPFPPAPAAPARARSSPPQRECRSARSPVAARPCGRSAPRAAPSHWRHSRDESPPRARSPAASNCDDRSAPHAHAVQDGGWRDAPIARATRPAARADSSTGLSSPRSRPRPASASSP